MKSFVLQLGAALHYLFHCKNLLNTDRATRSVPNATEGGGVNNNPPSSSLESVSRYHQHSSLALFWANRERHSSSLSSSLLQLDCLSLLVARSIASDFPLPFPRLLKIRILWLLLFYGGPLIKSETALQSHFSRWGSFQRPTRVTRERIL